MTGKPGSEDLHIGRRLRWRRLDHGMSQADLAAKLGVSFQQIAKYERGQNRISAGTLFVMAQILDTPVTWFFEGLELPDEQTAHQGVRVIDSNPLHTVSAHRTAELSRFIRSASRISDPEHRRTLLRLMTVMQRL